MTASDLVVDSPAFSTRAPAWDDTEERGLLQGALLAGCSALLVGRLLVPTEGTALGDTLPFAQLWLFLGLLGVWERHRQGGPRLSLDLCGVAVWLLAAGHVVGAATVLATTGDQRAALNMLWEWTALAVSFTVLRRVFSSSADRRHLLVMLLAAIVALAGFGIWQHFVWYPQSAAQYEKIRQELDRLERHRPAEGQVELSLRWQNRVDALRKELFDQGVEASMQSGPGRARLEDRLKHSTEPFGRFALANTFAGLLLVGLLLLCGLLWNAVREAAPGKGVRIAFLTAAVALVAYCLLLTKSRTAYVGLAAGVGMWGLCGLRHSRRAVFRLALWCIGATAIAAGALAAVAASGGIDLLVLREAPKSLRYRWEYWCGSWAVVKEQWLVGVGPGNFRQSYLAHKLPQSSEEISDPHNLFLDVWANGGILALAGLILLLCVVWSMFRSDAAPERPHEPEGLLESVRTRHARRSVLRAWGRSPVTWGGLSSFAALYAAQWGFDSSLIVLGLATAVVAALLCGLRCVPPRASAAQIWGAALVGLLVHLLGAGGIGMPAVTQLILLLLALGTPAPVAIGWQSPSVPGWQRLGLAAAAATLSIACLLSATLPVARRTFLMALGDEEFSRNPRIAEASYRRAAAADQLAAGPWERLAALQFTQSLRGVATGDDWFQQAADSQREAIRRDPRNFVGYRILGDYYRRRFAETQNPDEAAEAARQLETAATCYPHHAAMLAELAEALRGAERDAEARTRARHALELDDLNHVQAHTDKYLAPATRRRMEELSGSAAPPESLEKAGAATASRFGSTLCGRQRKSISLELACRDAPDCKLAWGAVPSAIRGKQ